MTIKEYLKENANTLLLAAMLGGVGGLAGAAIYNISEHKKNLRPDYVDSYKVSVENKDLDKDGKLEAIMGYNNREYLMKYDEASNLVSVTPYEPSVEMEK